MVHYSKFLAAFSNLHIGINSYQFDFVWAVFEWVSKNKKKAHNKNGWMGDEGSIIKLLKEQQRIEIWM